MDTDIRYVFNAEWYQEEASTIRYFVISYYPTDNTIEIYEPRIRKTFLKRIRINDLSENDCYPGARIDIFGRKFKITDYANSYTHDKLARTREKTFLLLQAEAVKHMGRILKCLNENGFLINNGRMVNFNSIAGKELFADVEIETLSSIQFQESAPSVGFELIRENAVELLKNCIESSNTACNSHLHELQTIFQENEVKNFIYCPKDLNTAQKQLKYFFDRKNSLKTSVCMKNSVLALIKPHAIKEGNAGCIISDIHGHDFEITGLKMILMESINAQEFYEVYRGVATEYVDMVQQLTSGVCMALEIVSKNEKFQNVHKEFRNFCGPPDPEIGKILRPNSLRAKYGKDLVRNAVHCTDLPDDILLELEYFFKILEIYSAQTHINTQCTSHT